MQIILSWPDTPGTPLYLPLSLRHTFFYIDKKHSKRIDTIDKNNNKKGKDNDTDDGNDNETIKEDNTLIDDIVTPEPLYFVLFTFLTIENLK